MIRYMHAGDMDVVLGLAGEIEMFDTDGMSDLQRAMEMYFEGEMDGTQYWLVDVEEDGELVGVSYFALLPMTDQTWDIYFIAVKASAQGKHKGREMMRNVEEQIKEKGGRLVIVETSGLSSYAGARAFYERCGYEEEGRLRDFYQQGEDKVIYRKVL